MLPQRTFLFTRISVSVCAFVFALSLPARAELNARLLAQLDPFTGNNRYADVWGEGHYAYLGSFSGSGVMIIDITNLNAPVLAGHYDPPAGGRFQDVVVIGGIGYFSSENDGGVHIVDVRDPASPKLLSQVGTAQNGYGRVHELFVADGILYEADSRTPTVKIFDVRNPAAPVFVRDLMTTDSRFIHNITALNGRLYTSGWGGKTDIYDVRRILTEAPVLLGSVDSGNASHSNWVSNDGRLLASARETLDGDVRLFDISDPASPKLLATITAASLGLSAYSVHNPYIVGNLLFASWYQAGTQVIDITDPAKPVLVGSYDTFADPVNGFDGNWGVYPFLGLDRVLLSDLDGGLFIVDFSNAAAGPRTVSAASYAISALTEKAIVAAFGSNLAVATQGATSLPLPTALSGTTVRVQDSTGAERLAPLFYVSPLQVNYQIPPGTAAGPATIKITSGDGRISTGAAIIAAAAPSLFTLDQSGAGAAAALDAFTFTGPPYAATRSGGEPNIIAFYGTGLGADATDADGNVSASVKAAIDGTPATVEYAGRAPGFVGLNQLNIALPSGLTPGTHNVVVKRNGRTGNTVTIAIRQ
ncbi:MAG TPA: hypothetical protein VNQ79_05490 [Blastocatellia bacterium]|nr:hypothetical protein [Blastocatellia bacterium]